MSVLEELGIVIDTNPLEGPSFNRFSGMFLVCFLDFLEVLTVFSRFSWNFKWFC